MVAGLFNLLWGMYWDWRRNRVRKERAEAADVYAVRPRKQKDNDGQGQSATSSLAQDSSTANGQLAQPRSRRVFVVHWNRTKRKWQPSFHYCLLVAEIDGEKSVHRDTEGMLLEHRKKICNCISTPNPIIP
jgi:hypothetical protein